jgi:hypothetical protein
MPAGWRNDHSRIGFVSRVEPAALIVAMASQLPTTAATSRQFNDGLSAPQSSLFA